MLAFYNMNFRFARKKKKGKKGVRSCNHALFAGAIMLIQQDQVFPGFPHS
jgi:hypothetical protein